MTDPHASVALRVGLDERRERRLRGETVAAGARILEEHGVVVIEQTIESGLLASLQGMTGGAVEIAADAPASLAPPFVEALYRGQGRMDFQIDPVSLLTVSEILIHWSFHPILRARLGARMRVVSAGVITAMPGSGYQGVHTDGPVKAGQVCHLFVPLSDWTEDNGPTQFWLGSHRLSGARPRSLRFSWRRCLKEVDDALAAHWTRGASWLDVLSDLGGPMPPSLRHDKTLSKLRQFLKNRIAVAGFPFASYRPIVKCGSAFIADYIVLHRGVGNRTASPRNLFYVTFSGSRDYVVDKNFAQRASLSPEALAHVAEPIRSLFTP